MQRNSKSVLITGCSSGIGQYLTEALKKDGWEIIATDKTAAEGMLRLDLMDSNSIKEAVQKVDDMTKGRLYALINNAGIAYAGRLEEITRDDLRKQFEVNVFGVHELTKRVIPIFRRNGKGRIINISSINGRVSFPNMGAYSASKFALEALTDALRLELMGTDIKVSLIEPGSIESNLRRDAVCRSFKLKSKEGRSPAIVCRKVKHALKSRRPKIRYLAGDEYIIYLKKLLPDRIFDKVMKYV